MKKLKVLIGLILVVALSGCTALSPASIEKAEKYMDKDKIEEAREVYEELIDEDEEDYDAWFGLVDTYYETEEFDLAADIMNDLAEIVVDDLDEDDDEFEDVAETFYELLEDLDDEDVYYSSDYDFIVELLELTKAYDDDLDKENISFIVDYTTTLVGISMPTESLMRWDEEGRNIKQQLEQRGYLVELEFAENDASLQEEQIDNMIEAHCDIIIIAPMDDASLADVLEEANNYGIVVISYDQLITDTSDVDYFVTFDDYLSGSLQGQYIVEALQLEDSNETYNIEIFAGSSEDSDANQLYSGAMDVLKPYIDNGQLEILSGESAMNEVAIQSWGSDDAETRMDNILNSEYTNQRVDVVLSPSDYMSQGIISALLDDDYGTHGKPMPIVTGADCDLVNIGFIVDGKQSISIFENSRVISTAVANMVEDIVTDNELTVVEDDRYDNGSKVVPTYLCNSLVVNRENYTEILLDSGYYSQNQINSNSSNQVVPYHTAGYELSLDEAIESEITQGEIEYYTFTPDTSAMYVIETLSDIDTYGYIYESDNEVGYNDDSGEGGNFRIEQFLTEDITYEIVVRGYSDSTSGEFALVVSQAGDGGFSNGEAYDLWLNENKESYLSADEYEYYTFTPSTSGWFTIQTTGSVDTYGVLFLNGYELTTNDDSGTGSNFTIEYELTANTTYEILVRGYSSSNSGDYSIMVSQEGSASIMDDAYELWLNENKYSYLDAGEEEYYSFTPSTSGLYVIETTGDVDTHGTLYVDGYELTTNDDGGDSGNFRIEFNLSANITYEILVRGYSSYDSGDYYITVSQVDTNSASSSTDFYDLWLNENRNSYLSSGENEYYSFTPSVSGTYIIETTGYTDTYGTLYNDSYELTHNDDSGTSGNFRIEYDLIENTTYEIIVRGFSSSTTGDYSISIIQESNGVSTSSDAPYSLRLYNAVNSDLYAGETEFFSFTPNESGRYVIRTTGSTDTYGSLYLDGSYITENDDGGDSGNFLLDVDLTGGRTYIIEVTGYSSSTSGSYSITIS